MKYKVGDKFLVEITGCNKSCYPYELNDIGIVTSEENLDKLCKLEDMTAEEAWEIARKIVLLVSDGGFRANDLEDIFGTDKFSSILESFTPQQAKEKIKAWEEKKGINVGDVVFHPGANKKCVVTSISNDGYIHMLNKDGGHHICGDKTCLKKTGRHIDIQSLLRQIGGITDG